MVSQTATTVQFLSICGFALGLMLLVLIIAAIYGWWKNNPFSYPHLIVEFDVSGKRQPNPDDYLDRFLCQSEVLDVIEAHEQTVAEWKETEEARARKMLFSSHRIKQYESAVDDECSYRIRLLRDKTKYRQSNGIRTSYKVSEVDREFGCDRDFLMERYEELEAIGFETTLSKYYAKEQRKLMTPGLRSRIKQRDNYTCQICGKYMPDGVGLQIDHIVPIKKGGKTVPSNLQVLCSRCNARKGAK